MQLRYLVFAFLLPTTALAQLTSAQITQLEATHDKCKQFIIPSKVEYSHNRRYVRLRPGDEAHYASTHPECAAADAQLFPLAQQREDDLNNSLTIRAQHAPLPGTSQ